MALSPIWPEGQAKLLAAVWSSTLAERRRGRVDNAQNKASGHVQPGNLRHKSVWVKTTDSFIGFIAAPSLHLGREINSSPHEFWIQPPAWPCRKPTRAHAKLHGPSIALFTVAPEQKVEPVAFAVSRAQLVALLEQGIQCILWSDSGAKQWTLQGPILLPCQGREANSDLHLLQDIVMPL